MAGKAKTLRLGTRGSMLARMQSQTIADAIEKQHQDVEVELVILKTSGDQIQDKPLHDAGGKGLFTKELEEALLAGTIDFAVHSFKDLPVTMPLTDSSKLLIAATPVREDVRDVLISCKGKTLVELPAGAKLGTGSLRRQCQALAIRGDLKIEPIRGNIDTRIHKLREGQYDAIILAMAGLKRSGMFDATDMNPIPTEQMLPAAGQGAIALQCRRDDENTIKLLSALDDAVTHQCVDLERSLVAELEGDCHSPIAAWAAVERDTIHFSAAVGAAKGKLPVIRATATADVKSPQPAFKSVLRELEKKGARKLLKH